MKNRPTLEEARKKLTTFQKILLEEIWQHFQAKKEWPRIRSLYSKHGKGKVQSALQLLKGKIGQEENGNGRWSRYKLSLLGVMLTREGASLQKLMLRFYEFQRQLFQDDPEADNVDSARISKALGLNEKETELLGELLWLDSFGGSRGGNNGAWTSSAMEEAADFPQTGNLTTKLEERLFRYYSNDFSRISPRISLRGYGNLLSSQYHEPLGTDQHIDEISVSLERLREKFPDPTKLGFLIMRFTASEPFKQLEKVIKETAKKHGVIIVRADDVPLHNDLWGNIRTLLHGCSFGIAVYERINQEHPNANVGLEVGYLMAMNKPVLLLKDKTVPALQSDLAGKLYRDFDTHNPKATIPSQLTNWLKHNGIIVS